MNRSFSLIVLTVILFLFACKKENNITEPTNTDTLITSIPTPPIDAEFMPFIELFLEEGEKRGHNISIQNLEVKFVDEFSISSIRNGDFCGYGWWNYPGRGIPRVEILRNDTACWETLTDLENTEKMTTARPTDRRHTTPQLSF